MGTSYIDNTLHSAANAVGTATGGGTDFVLLQDTGVQSDGEFTGYGILITAGRGAGQQRRIVAYDHSGHPNGERCATVNAAWAVTPDATSVYEITVGSDVNSGANPVAGATGPWRTIDAGMNAIATIGAGAQIIYVKAGRAYPETATIDTARMMGQTVTFEGYTITPGDGGRVVIDGGGVRNVGVNSAISAAVYYVLRNFTVINCLANGFDLTGVSLVRLVNCRAADNGGTGFSTGPDNLLLGCESVANGSNGFFCINAGTSLGTLLVHCLAQGNANNQFRYGSMTLLFCTASDLPNDKAAVYGQLASDAAYLINCTIDGTGSSGAIGMNLSSSVRHLIINTIFSNLSKGIQASTNDYLRLARHNLFFNCPDGEMINFPTDGDDMTSDPLYVDAMAGDLRLLVGSPVLRAGYPEFVDIGSRQHASRSTIGGPCRRGMQG